MSANIIVEASAVWGYFQSKKADLFGTLILIAENPEYGTEIYLTNDCGYPDITVMADNVVVDEEIPANPTVCFLTVAELYNNYLTVSAVKLLSGADKSNGKEDDYETSIANQNGEELTAEDEQEMIEDREDALSLAVVDFITAVTDESYYNSDPACNAIIEDVKDHFCEYLARKHGLPVRRPMYLSYPDGVEFEEYPYENMEFEDEGNPIYKKK